MASSNEQQLQFLGEAQRKVKEQAFYMKRAIVSVKIGVGSAESSKI